ncbi:MAG TPA: hypothetical protein VGF55_09980 [Gemmataceae bacterium]|jgi:hypothetical protein
MRRELQRIALVALTGIGLCSLACQRTPQRGELPPPTGATLEGTVTYGGQKVMVALVIAQSQSTAVSGFVDDSGHYKLKDVPLGEVNIAVNTAAGKGAMSGRIQARAHAKSKEPLPTVVDVPAKYGNPDTSGIKTTINAGENKLDIVIPK